MEESEAVTSTESPAVTAELHELAQLVATVAVELSVVARLMLQPRLALGRCPS